ncbi:hypothetical protein OTU49_017505 [Cherax quadricarinatus]|uniref:RB1-inducible coiled-coil protein 1 n=1 Tax=Cherax quadricarinatus TaxID=27406 RepID=A0AAW0VSJ3_CHEQU
MIYVFLVDTGTMMTFDMNLALENVSVLKEVIHRAMKVPPEKQVLLISGGEALDPNLRVCQYSAGTDTNPIFLFSKTTIEGQDPPPPSIDYGTDTDLKVHWYNTMMLISGWYRMMVLISGLYSMKMLISGL